MDAMLRQLVEELGISRSQFAKNIHMDRSQTVKILNGTLPVSRRFYLAVMSADFISDDFKQRFSDAYSNKSEPLNHYTDVIRHFAARMTERPDAVLAGELGRGVYRLTKRALERGETVRAVHTSALPDVEQALLQALRETGSKALRCVMHAPPGVSTQAVDTLMSLAGFAEQGVQTWLTDEPFGGAFPYAVFSESFAALCDADENHIIVEDGSVSGALARSFARLTAESAKAAVFFEDEAATLTNDETFLSERGAVYISNHFCPVGLLDADLLRQAARPDLPAEYREILIRNTICAYEKRAAEMEAVYVTSCAVEDFARTGRLNAITERYILPFSVEERIELLHRLQERVRLDRAFLIKTDPLRFQGDVNIYRDTLDVGLCGPEMPRDLYCAHILLQKDRLRGLEGLCGALRAYLPVSKAVMAKIGANYFLESVIASLREKAD